MDDAFAESAETLRDERKNDKDCRRACRDGGEKTRAAPGNDIGQADRNGLLGCSDRTPASWRRG
jgi:hypothetical protein